MTVSEPDALACQPIKIRRLDPCRTVATQPVVAHVICEDEDDVGAIWLLCAICVGSAQQGDDGIND